MAWRVAESLEVLRRQLNTAFPNRSKLSDGGIGDAKHASRNSDHNPWVKDKNGVGIVTARDFTHDPKNGLDCNKLAEWLIESRDPRIKYIIWNRRILSSKTSAWQWRTYNGVNAHTKHLHLSVMPGQLLYDDPRPWDLDVAVTIPTVQTAPVMPKKQVVVAGANPFSNLTESEINQGLSASITPNPSSTLPNGAGTQAVFVPATTPQTEGNQTADQIPPQPEPPPVEVAQVKPETEPEKEISGIKASFAAAFTFITTSGMGVLTWLGGVAWQIVAVLAIAAIVVGIIFIINRFWYANREKQRAHEERMEREKRAHEIQMATIQSAMRKDLNTVTIVPQPIQNSEEVKG